MTKAEIEYELTNITLDTWHDASQARIQKLSSRLMERLVRINDELSEVDQAAA